MNETELSESNVNKTLKRMVRDGQVKKEGRGCYVRQRRCQKGCQKCQDVRMAAAKLTT